MSDDPDAGETIEQPRKDQPLHRRARFERPAERPPDLVLRLLLADVVRETGAARRMQQDRTSHPVGRFEQGEESRIVERHSVHVREHLDPEGAELGDGSLDLNDAR